jgi:hypothetical protein
MCSVGYDSIDFDQPDALEECKKVSQKADGNKMGAQVTIFIKTFIMKLS